MNEKRVPLFNPHMKYLTDKDIINFAFEPSIRGIDYYNLQQRAESDRRRLQEKQAEFRRSLYETLKK